MMSIHNIRKMILVLGLIVLAVVAFAACSSESEEELSYEQISGDAAKALMESESDYVIIDARTQEEYDDGHIPGAIVIPEYEIANKAEKELPDKDQLILVYCRSGRRSKIACQELVKLGYSNVKEFGGIIDWKYEIEK
ncbi:MAG: rhodanese-like domain-containing protein [Acutalibacteraceae bacterium]